MNLIAVATLLQFVTVVGHMHREISQNLLVVLDKEAELGLVQSNMAQKVETWKGPRISMIGTS